MTCNCIGGNPCPCQRGGMMMGRVVLQQSWPWPTSAAPQVPNGELLDLLAKAKQRIMTPKEIYEQKVSFIFGQLMDCAPNVTEEEVRRHIAELGVVDPEPSSPSAAGDADK